MAYLIDDDKQNENGQAKSEENSGATVGASGAPAVIAGSSVSQAGVGPGGTGGWTNIQSYLNANEGSKQQSADMAKQKIGGEFSSEATRLAEESNQAKKSAADDVSKNTMTLDQTKSNVNALSNQYQYKAPQTDAYKTGVTNLKNAASYQYKGPTEYNYALNAKAQGYGDATKNDTAWGQTMNSLYGDAANGQLGQGQQSLQTQLDVNNEYLADARKGLGTQYDDLTSNVQKTVGDTTSALQGYAKQASDNVKGANDYFASQSKSDRNAVADSALNHRLGELMLTAQGSQYGATNLAKNGGYQDATYTGGTKATLENALGVDQERNRYNALQDILDGSERIQKSETGPSFGTVSRYGRTVADGKGTYDQGTGQLADLASGANAKVLADLSSGKLSDSTKAWLDVAKGKKQVEGNAIFDQLGAVQAAQAAKDDQTGYWKSVLNLLGDYG